MKRTLFPPWVYLAAPLLGGTAIGLLIRQDTQAVFSLPKPLLTPPGWVFPVVWTVLYILMGLSAIRIRQSGSPRAGQVLVLWWMQLVVNLLWPILFFHVQRFGWAFLWLLLLLVLILSMVRSFSPIDRAAAQLQTPYFFWVLFAGYLNLGFFLLNR